MKKLLILSILAAALLCGCSNAKPEATTAPTQQTGAAQELPSQGPGVAVTPEEGDIQIPIG